MDKEKAWEGLASILNMLRRAKSDVTDKEERMQDIMLLPAKPCLLQGLQQVRYKIGAYLQMHISDVLAKRHPSLPVNDLYSDGRIALGFEHIVDQVLGCKVHIAAAVRVVLTQHTLWVETAQAPAGADTCLAIHARSWPSSNLVAGGHLKSSRHAISKACNVSRALTRLPYSQICTRFIARHL